MNAVTSDMLPTLCELAEAPPPERPLDGIGLKALLDGEMTERPSPICFWSYDTRHETAGDPKPYIDPQLQEGTTPLAKIMDGRFTRNFRNFHHRKSPRTTFSARGRYSTTATSWSSAANAATKTVKELFDLRADQAEETNLVEAQRRSPPTWSGSFGSGRNRC